ncbi:MAG: hypothetical protein PHY43_00060 [Verrucomicrobiales bacterium]|nr:hypothetical protein [Verrucomicrobiales bacterium]
MSEYRKHFTTAILALLAGIVLSGCTSYRIAVNGFNDPKYAGGHSYWLLSGEDGVTVDDLEFREYAAFLRRGLAQAGYSESVTPDQADLAIFVSYGIGDAKAQAYSYSTPIYGQTGGGTYNFSGTTYSSYGSAMTYGTATQTPQYGVVGAQQFSGSTITFLRYLSLDVFDMKALQNEKKKVPVWRTDVMSRGTSGDLRSVFPVLVAAATPHFGENTKKQVVVDISEGNKQVQQIKAGIDTNQK